MAKETNWQALLDRFYPHIGNRRYGLAAQKMAELVEALRRRYADTSLLADASLFTLTVKLPIVSSGFDIDWVDEDRAYLVSWFDREGVVKQESYATPDEVVEVIERYVRAHTED